MYEWPGGRGRELMVCQVELVGEVGITRTTVWVEDLCMEDGDRHCRGDNSFCEGWRNERLWGSISNWSGKLEVRVETLRNY